MASLDVPLNLINSLGHEEQVNISTYSLFVEVSPTLIEFKVICNSVTVLGALDIVDIDEDEAILKYNSSL
jgi:hypothetical protein